MNKTSTGESSGSKASWAARHRAASAWLFSALTISVGVGMAVNEAHLEKEAAAQARIALRSDRRCLKVVRENLQPGTEIARVAIADLEPSEQKACMVDSILSPVAVEGEPKAPTSLPAIVDAQVELKSISELEAAEARDAHAVAIGVDHGQVVKSGVLGLLAMPLVVIMWKADMNGRPPARTPGVPPQSTV